MIRQANQLMAEIIWTPELIHYNRKFQLLLLKIIKERTPLLIYGCLYSRVINILSYNYDVGTNIKKCVITSIPLHHVQFKHPMCFEVSPHDMLGI